MEEEGRSMITTQDPNLPVSQAEMAGMLCVAKETLAYYYRTGKIPRPHRCGICNYYTAAEARQIVEWWEGRKRKLTFRQEETPCEDRN
jgi:hypothetical protein